MLTRDAFHARSADLTYPPAGVFAGFVLERFGAHGLRRAYLAVSGDGDEVAGWDAAAVKARLSEALGAPWPQLAAAFAAHVADAAEAALLPGVPPGPWSATTIAARADSLKLRGVGTADRRHVAFIVTRPGGEARGALLFGGGQEKAPPNALFAEHFAGRVYHGETHALVFSPDEAKLYDYRRQELVALHAQGFWPSADFTRHGGSALSFTLRKDLLPVGSCVLVDQSN